MARTPAYPDSVYFEAIEANTSADGTLPSIDTVIRAVGIGSRARVGRLLNQVRAKAKAVLPAPRSDIERMVYEMLYPIALEEARREARAALANESRAIRRRLHERRRALESTYAELRIGGSRIQQENADLVSKIKALEERERRRREINVRLRTRLQSTEEAHEKLVDSLRNQTADLRDAVSRGTAGIEGLPDLLNHSLSALDNRIAGVIEEAGQGRVLAEQEARSLAKQLEAERRKTQENLKTLQQLAGEVSECKKQIVAGNKTANAMLPAIKKLESHVEAMATSDQVEDLEGVLKAALPKGSTRRTK